MPDVMENANPEQALRVTRIIWCAMMIGPLVLFGVMSPKIFSTQPPPASAEDMRKIFPLIAGALALIELPVLYVLRASIYKKQTEGDTVTPQGYVSGNLILFAGCEGLMLFVVVSCMLTQSVMPTSLPGILALLVLLFNFPNGRAMYPDGVLPNPFNPDAK